MDNFRNANLIKSLLIDTFLSKTPNIIIGNEIQFAKKSNYADLIFLKNNHVTAFEIKSENDDLRKLKKQSETYRKVFNYLFIVITEKHLSKINHHLKGYEGLILINSDNSIKILQKPKSIKRNTKKDILASITKEYLISYFNISKYLSAKLTRDKLLKKNLKEIRVCYYHYLIKKLKPKNLLFFSERGLKTHYEDVSLLSFDETTELF